MLRIGAGARLMKRRPHGAGWLNDAPFPAPAAYRTKPKLAPVLRRIT